MTLRAGIEKLIDGGCRRRIQFAHLSIQGAEVIEPAHAKKPASEKIKQSCDPFTHVETLGTENAKEGLQYPRNRIVQGSCDIAPVSGAIHAGNKKEVNEPAYTKQPKSEQPDRS